MNKIGKIINIASIVFLGSLVIFYGYRFIHFYRLEHQNNSNEPIKLYKVLINKKGIEGMNYGLQKEENEYVFAPKSTDNYLYYAGRKWRIIGIDENNNVKIITEEAQTILPWEPDKNFTDSNINAWLNSSDIENSGIFEKSLKNEVNNLVKSNSVSTLLTKEELEKIGLDSYLVNGTNFWIIGENNERSYVTSNGQIKDDAEDYDTFNIRPVITLNNEFNYVYGDGSENNPYLILSYEKEKLTSSFVGEYLKYNDYLWRIIETNDDSIKVALEGYLDKEENTFSSKNNSFNPSEGIGLYLNDEFFNSLDNNDYILTKDYYIGAYNKNEIYSYLNTYENKIEANIGLYQIGDFFINNYGDFYTLTTSESSSKTIYVINKNNKLYGDFISSNYKIRPVLYLDSNLFIVNGDGSENNPYEIGRDRDEKEEQR